MSARHLGFSTAMIILIIPSSGDAKRLIGGLTIFLPTFYENAGGGAYEDESAIMSKYYNNNNNYYYYKNTQQLQHYYYELSVTFSKDFPTFIDFFYFLVDCIFNTNCLYFQYVHCALVG